MENGSFQPQLRGFDFGPEQDHEDFVMLKPEKTDEAALSLTANMEAEVHYSPALEALFQQNEDITARLKVTLQRLSQFESSLNNETEKNQKLAKANHSLQDQLLIWKEKERLWLEKLEKSEQKIEELNKQIPKYAQLQTEVQRYKKYHEKVKTQVKPYLQQLKDYSNNLIGEIRELHHELMSKDHALNKKVHRVQELESELKMQMGAHQSALEELHAIHSTEVKSLQSQIQSMKEGLIALEVRSERLDQTLERQDELDNMLVVLTRKAEEAESRTQSETEGLRQTLQMTKNDLLKRTMQLEDGEAQKAKLKDDNSRMQSQLETMNEQLTGLRYLWNDKAEENEKLKNSISALEKINQELSLKLAQVRQQL